MKGTPYWWDIASPPEQFEQSELPSTADVLVIGAGLTGLSASRTLAKAGKSVVCVDAGAPGIGASSRNGGMIGGGHRVPWDKLVARYGKQAAADLTRELHIDSMEFAKSLMADEGIDCDYSETGRLQALWRASEYESVARNFSEISKSVPISIEMIPKSKVRDHVSTEMYGGGAIYHRHGGLNPAKWMAGIRDAAKRAGAKLHGNTPVIAIERTGASIAAKTPQGIISAGTGLDCDQWIHAEFDGTGKPPRISGAQLHHRVRGTRGKPRSKHAPQHEDDHGDPRQALLFQAVSRRQAACVRRARSDVQRAGALCAKSDAQPYDGNIPRNAQR